MMLENGNDGNDQKCETEDPSRSMPNIHSFLRIVAHSYV